MQTPDERKLFRYVKGDFLRALICPFLICFKHKIEFFLWILFVIVAGQLGTIINIINRVVFLKWDFLPAIGPDSISGTFYTFSLVLIASLLAPLFINFIKDEKPHYRRIGMIFVSILISSLILCAVFYSFSTQNINYIDFSQLKNSDVCIDKSQLTFFVLALLLAWYSFGYSLLGSHEKELGLSDDFQAIDNEAKIELSEKSEQRTNDGNGVNI